MTTTTPYTRYKLDNQQRDMLKDVLGSAMILTNDETDLLSHIVNENIYLEKDMDYLKKIRSRWIVYIKQTRNETSKQVN